MDAFINAIDLLAIGEILIAFILKLSDNALGTFKTICIAKGKYLAASLFASLSTMFYLLAIVRIANSSNVYSMIAMCCATFLGTLLPAKLLKRTEKDKLFIFDITSNTCDNGVVFADMLRAKNVALNTSVVYNRDMEKVLLIKVYCQSKAESRLVLEELKNEDAFKYNVYAPIED